MRGAGRGRLGGAKPNETERVGARPVPGVRWRKGLTQSYFPGLETLTHLRERVGSVALKTWSEAHIAGVFALSHHLRDYRKESYEPQPSRYSAALRGSMYLE